MSERLNSNQNNGTGSDATGWEALSGMAAGRTGEAGGQGAQSGA